MEKLIPSFAEYNAEVEFPPPPPITFDRVSEIQKFFMNPASGRADSRINKIFLDFMSCIQSYWEGGTPLQQKVWWCAPPPPPQKKNYFEQDK